MYGLINSILSDKKEVLYSPALVYGTSYMMKYLIYPNKH